MLPSSKVELSVSCRKLLDLDVFSKSDPMVVLFEYEGDKWVEIGRTEVIKDNLNPDFVRKIIMDYCFETQQRLRFRVVDWDCDSSDLESQDFIGQCEVTLGEIASSGRISKPLAPRDCSTGYCGTIIITAEEISSCKDEIMMRISGRNLRKIGFFASSNFHLELYRIDEDNNRTVVYRTKVVKGSTNPTWEEVRISVTHLCNNDEHRPIIVTCINQTCGTKEHSIGEVTTSLNELLNSKNSVTQTLNLSHPSKKGCDNCGQLLIHQARRLKRYSFLDYVQSGVKLHCCIAIDFTASNGDPRNPGTLHYSDQMTPSIYCVALRAILEIIRDYDSDNLFPAFGFGARLPPTYEVSHCFPLNGQPNNPDCAGIDAVVAAYYNTLFNVRLYGPTNFSPVIHFLTNLASQVRNGEHYYILLIITDGVISDMTQTKAAIVNASSLPISIIIVGVGSADFSAMTELDGDDIRISSNGQLAVRDIVQFVPFSDFFTPSNTHRSQQRLAKAVLAEIPEQFVSYMQLNAFTPLHTHHNSAPTCVNSDRSQNMPFAPSSIINSQYPIQTPNSYAPH